jgi:hypothetical protein
MHAGPPSLRLLKEIKTQIILQAKKLMTDGSFVHNPSTSCCVSSIPIDCDTRHLKAAKGDLTGIESQLSTIAALPTDSREAVANLLHEPEIFLALKEISTGKNDGSNYQMFFEK